MHHIMYNQLQDQENDIMEYFEFSSTMIKLLSKDISSYSGSKGSGYVCALKYRLCSQLLRINSCYPLILSNTSNSVKHNSVQLCSCNSCSNAAKYVHVQ